MEAQETRPSGTSLFTRTSCLMVLFRLTFVHQAVSPGSILRAVPLRVAIIALILSPHMDFKWLVADRNNANLVRVARGIVPAHSRTFYDGPTAMLYMGTYEIAHLRFPHCAKMVYCIRHHQSPPIFTHYSYTYGIHECQLSSARHTLCISRPIFSTMLRISKSASLRSSEYTKNCA